MTQHDGHAYFWPNLLRAVEVEPREAKSLRGSSGIDHAITAAGIDQDRRRLVIITSESDPRTSAFVQSDLQLAFPDFKVIAARPEMYDRGSMVALFEDFPEMLKAEDLRKAIADSPRFNELIAGMGRSQRLITGLEFWKDNGMWNQVTLAYMSFVFSATALLIPPEQRPSAFLSLSGFSPGADAMVGICRIPVHQFTEADAELIKSGNKLGEIQTVLKKLAILQYFFPPPDNLALGLIERCAPTTDILITQLESCIERGHPFGPNELVPASGSLPTMIDSLRDRGYVMEGERILEVTDTGKSIRETVKFKPRESLVSKIINQFSIKFDLKDMFK
jgi:hypothetical protein